MSWALSCLQLKKIYGNITLHSNSAGAELLVETLKLPYSEVYTTHDALKLPDLNLWALPKIYTYALQNKPFLHIDGDVFLFDKLPDQLLQSPLIAQNIEVSTEYYSSTQKQLMKHLTYFPSCVKNDFYSGIPVSAVNAGILGGSDIDFIKYYTTEAINYINRNVSHLQSINTDRFNVFFEQHLFYSLANEQNKSIQYLFNDIFEDRGYLYLGNFHEVPLERTYLHLLGHYKKDEQTCLQMASKLRELYPEYYYRIIDLYQKNNWPLFTSFYNNKSISIKKDYLSLVNKSIECFNKDLYRNSLNSKVLSFDLSFLDVIYNQYADSSNITFDVQHFKDDYILFFEKLSDILKLNSSLSEFYFYGRDLRSVEWHTSVFGNMSNVVNVRLVQTKGVHIIESSFNWAGFLNKIYRVGAVYYETLAVCEEQFFNLVVPEVVGSQFILYDIDGIEKNVLELLSEPKSIQEILNIMQIYFDNDVIQNYYKAYQEYLFEVIKQLLLKKVIQPLL
jgi:hypothetical protein